MSPRTEKQFENIRRDKIALISETALRLFATHGYESTSISMISKEAGISKGLMYNYFEGKESLLNWIISDGLDKFIGELNLEDKTEVKREDIIAFIDSNIQGLKDNPEYYKLYFSLVFQEKALNIIKDNFMPYFEKLFLTITQYFEQKGIPDPYVKARYLMAVFDGIGMHYLSDIENFPLDEVRDMLVSQF